MAVLCRDGGSIPCSVFIYYYFATVEYAQIDWHDFILVETINFKESEMGTSLLANCTGHPLP